MVAKHEAANSLVGAVGQGEPDGRLACAAANLVHELTRLDLSLVLAESCTGGVIAAALTAVPGASACFWGGMIVYSGEAKRALVGVDPICITGDRVVSAATTRQLAERARKLSGADIGAAVTGWAGPNAPPAARVGDVYMAVSSAGETLQQFESLPGDRRAVRLAAACRLLGHIDTVARALGQGAVNE